jgi:hypothetical protein
MPTPFNIFGVVAPTGSRVVAALILPPGKFTSAGTTISGGSMGGPLTVPAGGNAVYAMLGLAEANEYDGSFTIGGTALPDTTDCPYTVRAKVVDPETNPGDYAAVAAAYVASSDVRWTRDVPDTLKGGTLKSGVWGQNLVAIQDETATPDSQRVITITRRNIVIRET